MDEQNDGYQTSSILRKLNTRICEDNGRLLGDLAKVRRAHSETTHATMARCLHCDMGRIRHAWGAQIPNHQGKQSCGMHGEREDIRSGPGVRRGQEDSEAHPTRGARHGTDGDVLEVQRRRRAANGKARSDQPG